MSLSFKKIELRFHSVGLDNEICFTSYGDEYEEFIANHPEKITVNYSIEVPRDEITVNGIVYTRKQ